MRSPCDRTVGLRARPRAVAGLVALLSLIVPSCALVPAPPADPPAVSTAALRVVAHLPEVPGFERSCQRGRGCVFGEAWSDDTDAKFGRNGCDQRSDVLRTQLTEVLVKPGTRGCVVQSGVLDDPYSGARVYYRRGDPARSVEVDHVVPLAGAWDRGAATWPLQRRRDFAGDPRNLVVTTAAANRTKGDKPPARWSPDTAAGRCLYARRYVAASVTYDLAVTRADVRALDRMLRLC